VITAGAGEVWLALLVIVSISWLGLFRGPVGAVSFGSFCWLLSMLSSPAVKKTALFQTLAFCGAPLPLLNSGLCRVWFRYLDNGIRSSVDRV
jgi:hypothetical protein